MLKHTEQASWSIVGEYLKNFNIFGKAHGMFLKELANRNKLKLTSFHKEKIEGKTE